METATDWTRADAMTAAIEAAGRAALARLDERCHAQTHLSQVYAQGSSVYATFVFRVGPDFETSFARWKALKAAVSEAIVAEGGTITHQHGVGKDHAPYLAAEKGDVGMNAIKAMIDSLDPRSALDSGNLTGGDLR
jgi:alkyldihydroxyacetonephosphate synthase